MSDDTTFTAEEQATFARIAGLIVPASAAHGAPGADDPDIAASALASAKGAPEALRAALAAFRSSADAETFRNEAPEAAQTMVIRSSVAARRAQAVRFTKEAATHALASLSAASARAPFVVESTRVRSPTTSGVYSTGFGSDATKAVISSHCWPVRSRPDGS